MLDTWSTGCWIPGVQGVGYLEYRVWDTWRGCESDDGVSSACDLHRVLDGRILEVLGQQTSIIPLLSIPLIKRYRNLQKKTVNHLT